MAAFIRPDGRCGRQYSFAIGTFVQTLWQKVIILIDEYDVPLDKAFSNGYYDEMSELIRGLLGQALKTNDFLQFAILTGCLRVSKESIFTGINNFKVLSIMDTRFDEQFGFTDEEVKQILTDYGLSSHFGEIKEWYDGYRFGNADVYCPWDVVNYIDLLCADSKALPQDFGLIPAVILLCADLLIRQMFRRKLK